MSYSRNFGIRSFENNVRAGRARTPAGSTLVIGEPVILDAAGAGFLKKATAGAAANGAGGVAVYQHIQMQGIDAALNTTSDLNTIPGGRYAQRVHGARKGVVQEHRRQDALRRSHPAAGALLASSVDVSTLAIGEQLTPDGAGKFKVANGTSDGNWLTVEQVNPSTGVIEARFNF